MGLIVANPCGVLKTSSLRVEGEAFGAVIAACRRPVAEVMGLRDAAAVEVIMKGGRAVLTVQVPLLRPELEPDRAIGGAPQDAGRAVLAMEPIVEKPELGIDRPVFFDPVFEHRLGQAGLPDRHSMTAALRIQTMVACAGFFDVLRMM